MAHLVRLAGTLLLALSPLLAHAQSDFNQDEAPPTPVAQQQPRPEPRDKPPVPSHDEGVTQGGAIFSPFTKAESPVAMPAKAPEASPDGWVAPLVAVVLALAIAIAFALLLRRAWLALA